MGDIADRDRASAGGGGIGFSFSGRHTDDVLIVTKLDRLARSSRDLLNIVSQITEVGASFKSLRDQCADTTTPTGRMILTVLSGIAEFERELINERTGEGRTRARERRSVRPAFEAVDVPASRSFTTERKPASR